MWFACELGPLTKILSAFFEAVLLSRFTVLYHSVPKLRVHYVYADSQKVLEVVFKQLRDFRLADKPSIVEDPLLSCSIGVVFQTQI